jgi:hypothetical protein
LKEEEMQRLPYGIGILFRHLPDPLRNPKRFALRLAKQNVRWIIFDITKTSQSLVYKYMGPILTKGIDAFLSIDMCSKNFDEQLKYLSHALIGAEGGLIINDTGLDNTTLLKIVYTCRALLSNFIPNNKSLGLITYNSEILPEILNKFDFVSINISGYRKIENIQSIIIPNFHSMSDCASFIDWIKVTKCNHGGLLFSDTCRNWAHYFYPVRIYNKAYYPKMDLGHI